MIKWKWMALALSLTVMGACDDDGDDDVTDPSGDVFVSVDGGYYLSIGETTQLVASTENGSDDAYTWSSSDPDVASVDGDGLVTAKKVGAATISATGDSSGVTGTLDIAVSQELPFYDAWASSGHGDYDAAPFRHWDEDGEVPQSCSRCHTTTGFQDQVGADGTNEGQVDGPHAPGAGIECVACHNSKASALDAAVFPSGEEVDGLGPNATCATCHQGRQSGVGVRAILDAAGVGDDEVSESISIFSVNVHYLQSAATLYAARVEGGFQYEGQAYDYKFRHVPAGNSCTDCHSPHSLQVKTETVCSECHEQFKENGSGDPRDIRMIVSQGVDYDGDGDLEEGLYYEVETLGEKLLLGIENYADEQGLPAICFNSLAFPYWFVDDNGNRVCDEGETTGYSQLTPRLAKALYNYTFVGNDPGSYAHNGKYAIKLLFDSITDLNSVLSDQVPMTFAMRDDPGHFNGASNANQRWGNDEPVSASCSRCHGGAAGFRFYTTFEESLEVTAPDNGMECYTCHDNVSSTFERYQVQTIIFPSGQRVEEGLESVMLCSNCHAGRRSGVQVEESIASGSTSLPNPHYLPGAAVRFGSGSNIGAEISGKAYPGVWSHVGGNSCNACHRATNSNHSFNVNNIVNDCKQCHVDAATLQDIKASSRGDYDGDGVAENLPTELAGMQEVLVEAMQGEADICYGGDRNFYNDTNSNGVCDASEIDSSNRFSEWTADLMRAGWNHNLVEYDGGGWAHNFNYLGRLLYDSTEALDAGLAGDMTRP